MLDYAWIDDSRGSIICIKKQMGIHLEKKDVKGRIVEYEQYYNRMCPGYQRGEILMRRETMFNMGILSYKSNTPNGMSSLLSGKEYTSASNGIETAKQSTDAKRKSLEGQLNIVKANIRSYQSSLDYWKYQLIIYREPESED